MPVSMPSQLTQREKRNEWPWPWAPTAAAVAFSLPGAAASRCHTVVCPTKLASIARLSDRRSVSQPARHQHCLPSTLSAVKGALGVPAPPPPQRAGKRTTWGGPNSLSAGPLHPIARPSCFPSLPPLQAPLSQASRSGMPLCRLHLACAPPCRRDHAPDRCPAAPAGLQAPAHPDFDSSPCQAGAAGRGPLERPQLGRPGGDEAPACRHHHDLAQGGGSRGCWRRRCLRRHPLPAARCKLVIPAPPLPACRRAART